MKAVTVSLFCETLFTTIGRLLLLQLLLLLVLGQVEFNNYELNLTLTLFFITKWLGLFRLQFYFKTKLA